MGDSLSDVGEALIVVGLIFGIGCELVTRLSATGEGRVWVVGLDSVGTDVSACWGAGFVPIGCILAASVTEGVGGCCGELGMRHSTRFSVFGTSGGVGLVSSSTSYYVSLSP